MIKTIEQTLDIIGRIIVMMPSLWVLGTFGNPNGEHTTFLSGMAIVGLIWVMIPAIKLISRGVGLIDDTKN